MAFKVNGESVADAMLAAETESLLARFRQLSPEQRAQFGFQDGSMEQRAHEWARENVIERILMRQEALRDAEPIPEETLEQAEEAMYKRFGGREKFAESGMTPETIRAEAEATVKLDRLLGRITSRVKAPKTSDVAARYRHEKERWQTGEQVHAAHIVKHINEQVSEEEARKAIDEAKAEIEGGATFEEVADKASDCPGNGGDLGWFGRGKMVDEFENVVFAMEPGHVSDVFRSVFGFHIAKLLEIRPSTHLPLSEVKGQIELELKREAENKAVEAFVDKLREKAVIEDAVPA
ncbi:MAG: peptidylprolyl isomerase [Acidobacteria bacterium]|nr:peptidylprolyl isomerase [Acidobacteriota bacterium]